MVFSVDVTTPANTQIANALRTPIILFIGLIYHIEVYFPPGPSGLVGVQLSAGNHQLLPYNNGSWLRGDNILFKYDDLLHFDISTSQMDIITYNIDAVYDHHILVNIELVTDVQFQEALAPTVSTASLVDAINTLTATISKGIPTGIKPKTSILGTG